MAPLDPEQRAEITEMIRLGTNAAHQASLIEIAKGKAETESIQADMRVTSEAAVSKLLEMSTELESKLAAANVDMSQRFVTIRKELVEEFANSRASMVSMSSGFAEAESNMRELLTAAEDQKTTMRIENSETFAEFKTKSEFLTDLITRSAEIQHASTTEVKSITNTAFSIMSDRFNSIEGKLQAAAEKMVHYDSLIAGQRQGKGAGRAEGSFPEVRSLIHEKDIKMPSFPEKPESPEIFRRWWKDVGEYCERFKTFPNCSFIFKKLRGYNDSLDEGLAVTTLFGKLDN